MVDLADNAWHACTFNRRSVGVETGGFASRGFDAPLLATTARVFAFLCYLYRHACAGVGPGVASHNDLGAAGGGHHDPSDDPSFMQRFIGWSTMSIVRAISPRCGIRTSLRRRVCCRLMKARCRRPVTSTAPLPDVHTIGGLQQALEMLGYRIAVDGDYGPETRQVVTTFQMRTGIIADGMAGHKRKQRYSAS
jgi:putative peptidoglycan binding protein/N-acetylmuramoyl-L-alanine amidase-like protein